MLHQRNRTARNELTEAKEKHVINLTEKLSNVHKRATKIAFSNYFNSFHMRPKLWEPQNRPLVQMFVRDNNNFIRRIAQRKADYNDDYTAQDRSNSILDLTPDDLVFKEMLGDVSYSFESPNQNNLVFEDLGHLSKTVHVDNSGDLLLSPVLQSSLRGEHSLKHMSSKSLILDDAKLFLRLKDPTSASQRDQIATLKQSDLIAALKQSNLTTSIKLGSPILVSIPDTSTASSIQTFSLRLEHTAVGSTNVLSDSSKSPSRSNQASRSFGVNDPIAASSPTVISSGFSNGSVFSNPTTTPKSKHRKLDEKRLLIQEAHNLKSQSNIRDLNALIQETEDIEQIHHEVSILTSGGLDVNAFVISSDLSHIVPGFYTVMKVHREMF